MSFKSYVKDTSLQVLGFLLIFFGVLLAMVPIFTISKSGLPIELCYVCMAVGAVIIVVGGIISAFASHRKNNRVY